MEEAISPFRDPAVLHYQPAHVLPVQLLRVFYTTKKAYLLWERWRKEPQCKSREEMLAQTSTAGKKILLSLILLLIIFMNPLPPKSKIKCWIGWKWQKANTLLKLMSRFFNNCSFKSRFVSPTYYSPLAALLSTSTKQMHLQHITCSGTTQLQLLQQFFRTWKYHGNFPIKIHGILSCSSMGRPGGHRVCWGWTDLLGPP